LQACPLAVHIAAVRRQPPRSKRGPIDAEALARAVMVIPKNEPQFRRLLHAAGHSTRLQIVRALAETPLAASDLARAVDRSAAGTSQHLKVLRDSGAVLATRQKNVIRYRLSDHQSARILEEVARAFDPLRRDGTSR